MKRILVALTAIIYITYTFTSCKKEEPCETITVVTTKTLAAVGATNGKIKITSPTGPNYTFSINNGAFQTDSVFNNLAIGSYTVTVKNKNNCTGTATIDLQNPCTGSTVIVTSSKFDAITGQSNGSLTVTSPVGSGFTYSINNGAFQASTNFNNLAAGTYTLRAKTNLGCEGTLSATVNGYGPKYHAVKQLIIGYCGPCHLNGGTSGNVTFDTDANIVAKWDRIKIRSVDNMPSVMPQGGPLTIADKQKITDWVNAGHTVNN